ncbi:MAG: hypothetical protein IJZ72_03330 [Oscillospiraceae bacterium]|nr:hypothetical protein [Oscillospiraceae bacterium]
MLREELEKARIDRNKKTAKRRKAEKKEQNNARNGLKSGGNGGIIKSEAQSELGTFKQKLQSDKRVSKEYYNIVKNKFSKGSDTAKKVFNKYIPKKSVENAYFEGIPHYSPSNKSIFMNFTTDLTNSRGAGATWFHEHGHMIDAVCGTVSNNSDFAKLLYDDYLAYMKAYGKRNGLKTFDKVQAAISKDLSSMREHSAVADLLNGISKGNILGVAGHSPGYWEDDSVLCSEAFAHMFEAQFDEKRYKQMQKYFPNALSKFEKMLGGLV